LSTDLESKEDLNAFRIRSLGRAQSCKPFRVLLVPL
jgi:hypothetical protein